MVVILFEALTRRVPFLGADYDVMSAHVGRRPPPLRSIVARALAKEPAGRFCSAGRTASACRPCNKAQASLAAWTCFENTRAIEAAGEAARLNQAWSPLKLLMSLAPSE